MNEIKPDILIVDDTPANLRVLSRLLVDNGYKVRPVPDGALALKAVEAATPDLIFLDIRMPGMDGYEVCEKLKAGEETRDIPVIFISALNELEDKVRGFSVGAVDFITKPFQEGEVLIRLSTHLTIRDQRRQIAEQLEALKRLETLRENLTQMIVHDMNNPLHGILGLTQLLRLELPKNTGERIAQYVISIEGNARSTIDMIRAILDVAKMESGELSIQAEKTDLGELSDGVATSIKPLLQEKNLTLDVSTHENLPSAIVDSELLRRVLVNLIGNAIKFSPDDGRIEVTVRLIEGAFEISVEDDGPGIPDEFRDTIFEKFGQVESAQSGRKYSTGLGLAFCKMAVEAHSGAISVDNRPEGGSRFTISVPTGTAT